MSQSKDSILEGQIKINQTLAKKGDYGEVGAFVQQDDVLSSTLTVRELLEFAAKMKLSLSDEMI